MVNISYAFRLRNRLKDKIQRLNGLIKKADFEKTVGTQENCTGLDGRTLKQAIEASIGLMSLLEEFNQAIDKANVVNRPDLVSLETLNAKIALYEQIAASCRACKGYDFEYPEQRNTNYDMVKVKKEMVVDQAAVIQELNGLKKAKNALEEKLSSSNGKTLVDFDAAKIMAEL